MRVFNPKLADAEFWEKDAVNILLKLRILVGEIPPILYEEVGAELRPLMEVVHQYESLLEVLIVIFKYLPELIRLVDIGH